MGRRLYSRQSSGRFRRATLENTFGLLALPKASRRAADPLARRCPYCQAAPGKPCVNTAWGGAMDRPHFMREDED